MQNSIVLFLLFITTWRAGVLYASTASTTMPDHSMLKLSEELLYAVRTESATDSLETVLASLPMQQLMEGLSNDTAKKTFWINLYNAFYQLLATREKKTRPGIFKEKLVRIAGHSFSLDDIEHGILRKYRWKYSMGYVAQFLPSRIIKRLAVNGIDYRIHFTLNCGAKSCPPIAFYQYERLDQQLETATRIFLRSETAIDTVGKTVQVSKILQWFKGDFWGKKGIRSLLSKVFNRDFTGYRIRFKDYDWSARLGYYQPE